MPYNVQKTFGLRKFATVVCALFALAGPALSAHGAQSGAHVKDIMVIEKEGDLLVFGSLRGVFSQKLLEAIHNGVPTKFIFDVSLFRSRKLIHDAAISSRRLHHQVTYSALKKTYTFILGEGAKSIEKRETRSKDEMVDWMRELNGALIASDEALSLEARYYVGVRARLDSVDLIFPFNYVLALLGGKSDWSYSPTFSAKGM